MTCHFNSSAPAAGAEQAQCASSLQMRKYHGYRRSHQAQPQSRSHRVNYEEGIVHRGGRRTPGVTSGRHCSDVACSIAFLQQL